MSEPVILDVRALIPRERHPKIFQAWEGLPVGGVLTLVNDHDPKPLYYEFRAERDGEFEWRPMERGPEKWVVEIRRVAAARPLPAPAAGTRPAWTDRPPLIVLDVREELRTGREPFEQIMAAAMQLEPGDVFVLRATFEPRPLFQVLGAKGFEAWPERMGEEDWIVYFRKKAQGHGCRCGGHGHG